MTAWNQVFVRLKPFGGRPRRNVRVAARTVRNLIKPSRSRSFSLMQVFTRNDVKKRYLIVHARELVLALLQLELVLVLRKVTHHACPI